MKSSTSVRRLIATLALAGAAALGALTAAHGGSAVANDSVWAQESVSDSGSGSSPEVVPPSSDANVVTPNDSIWG